MGCMGIFISNNAIDRVVGNILNKNWTDAAAAVFYSPEASKRTPHRVALTAGCEEHSQ